MTVVFVVVTVVSLFVNLFLVSNSSAAAAAAPPSAAPVDEPVGTKARVTMTVPLPTSQPSLGPRAAPTRHPIRAPIESHPPSAAPTRYTIRAAPPITTSAKQQPKMTSDEPGAASNKRSPRTSVTAIRHDGDPTGSPTALPSALPTISPTETDDGQVDRRWLQKLPSKWKFRKSVEGSMYSEHDWWLYPGPPVQQCVRKNNTEPGNAASPFNEYDFQSTAAFHTEESEVDEDGIAWPKGDWENGEEEAAAAEAAVGEKGSRGNIREEDGGPQEHTQDQDSWTEVRTTEGRTYYWNRASGATQWEPPDKFRRPGELKRRRRLSDISGDFLTTGAANDAIDVADDAVGSAASAGDLAEKMRSFFAQSDTTSTTSSSEQQAVGSNDYSPTTVTQEKEPESQSRSPCGIRHAAEQPTLPASLCSTDSPPVRILLLSFFTTTQKAENWKQDNTLGLKNRICYTAIRGYNYMIEVVDTNMDDSTNPEENMDDLPVMYYKPYLVSHYLQFTDWLVWMDYDLIVKNPHNFFEQYVTHDRFHLILTDHKEDINNGAFMLRNSDWGRQFVDHWRYLCSDRKRYPFTDNGPFAEAVLRFGSNALPENSRCSYGFDTCAKEAIKTPKEKPNHKFQKLLKVNLTPRQSSSKYVRCLGKWKTTLMGPWDRSNHRDIGRIRFVAQASGFNTHGWEKWKGQNGKRDREEFFTDEMFVLHNKFFDSRVPRSSVTCPLVKFANDSISALLRRQGAYMISSEHGVCDMDDPVCRTRHFLQSCQQTLEQTMSRAGIDQRKRMMLRQKNMVDKPHPVVPTEPHLYDAASSAVNCGPKEKYNESSALSPKKAKTSCTPAFKKRWPKQCK